MALEHYKLHILDLAQRWRLDVLNDAERSELETWFCSLEEMGLGVATEITVNKLENGYTNCWVKYRRDRIRKMSRLILSNRLFAL